MKTLQIDEIRKHAACAAILTLVCLFSYSSHSHATSTQANANDSQLVKRGALVYSRFCSLCHGKNLEGQPNWRQRKANGKLPAPPHDDTGHTWHHPDQMLFDITKNGLVPPNAPPNYLSDMPAWGSTLKDEDIWAVLAFIKSRWPKDIQEQQTEITIESLKRN